MAALDDDNTLFPPEWSWEKYAPAMREMAAQIARHSTAIDRLSPKEQEASGLLFELWRRRAIDEGHLPTYDERRKHEDQYLEILDSLVEDAKAKLAQGKLAIGVENVMLYPRLIKEYEETLTREDSSREPTCLATSRQRRRQGWTMWREWRNQRDRDLDPER